ncbi:MAG: methionine adenosyltransferase [Polyangiaceae bacterium]
MDLIVRRMDRSAPDLLPVEVVERKGRGHPDTLCDAVAERVSVKLSRAYLAATGAVLHHNVDKVLLCGGASRPAFGGGEVLSPIEIHLAGRVTRESGAQRFPVDDLAIAACREVLAEHVRWLDLDRHVRIHPHFRAASADLADLCARRTQDGVALANDTSIGAGFAPRTDLERVVMATERALTSAEAKLTCHALGDDVKVMGIRRGGRIRLTIACALVDRHLRDIDDYLAAREQVRILAYTAAGTETMLAVDVDVNTADDPARGSVYLTVTGTSAEAGDDGEVGRGNRASGLITPYRPMTLEAAAGKNPVAHAGKLYSVLAERAAIRLCTERPEIDAAEVVLVSRIGAPVSDPQLADIAVTMRSTSLPLPSEAEVRPIVASTLGALGPLCEDLLSGRVHVF